MYRPVYGPLHSFQEKMAVVAILAVTFIGRTRFVLEDASSVVPTEPARSLTAVSSETAAAIAGDTVLCERIESYIAEGLVFFVI